MIACNYCVPLHCGAGEEITSLRQQLADGNSEIERLRLLAEGKLAEAARLTWAEFKATPSGGYDISVRAPMVELIAETLVQDFKRAGGANYVEWNFTHEELGPFTITMQRRDGKTPANAAAEAKAEADDLRQQLEGERLLTGIAVAERDEWKKMCVAERERREKAEETVSLIREEVCGLLSCHIETPNLARDALRRTRDFIDERRAALSSPAQQKENTQWWTQPKSTLE
jgi:hypothetical protein